MANFLKMDVICQLDKNLSHIFMFNEGEFWQRNLPNCHNIIITSYPIT